MSSLIVLLICLARFGVSKGVKSSSSSPLLAVLDPQQQPYAFNATVTIDLNVRHTITPTLFGIFFEEIGHAGDGGLYAEMIHDRSFDATAAASGFSLTSSTRLPLHLNELAARHPSPLQPLKGPEISIDDAYPPYSNENSPLFSQTKGTSRHHFSASEADSPLKNLIVPWVALAGTSAILSRELPLNPGNQVAMELTVSQPSSESSPEGGIINFGYWGIAVQKGQSYGFSIYIRNPQADTIKVHVGLTSSDLATQHAELKLHAEGGGKWGKYTGTLLSSSSDSDSRLVLSFKGPATLIIDSLSLFPLENVVKAQDAGQINPWPFREDLLQALKNFKPGFLRFPGGCYVEGDWMRNAFNWKISIGTMEERPGHYNLWGYWSTDGLGLFEYMLLVEELGTEGVYVVNNGVAHGDGVPTAQALPLLQDTLDSIEFITGPANSTWGRVRARMGREEPWALNYIAIGNEDCGKPYYLENYNLFYGALHAAYPHMRLISNCDMGYTAPTDLWDWHVYTNPQVMFDLRKAFDALDPAVGHHVFASEYAVTDGGGWGNLIGAIAEAGFMTGLERNSQAVEMAAYAPLFVHWNNRPWPTNMIVINNHQWFGIPSYHVQRIFRETQGSQYAATTVAQPPGAEGTSETIAASATCQDSDCTLVAVKLVNFSPLEQVIAVNVRKGMAAPVINPMAEAVVLTSERPEDENSFDDPLKVSPMGMRLEGVSDSFMLQVPPWSLGVMQLHVAVAPSVAEETEQSGDILVKGADGHKISTAHAEV